MSKSVEGKQALNRRQFLTRLSIMVGGTLSASLVNGIMAGASASPIAAGSAGKILSAGEVAFLDRICDLIIPRTDTPGAHDVGVVGFIDSFYSDYETKGARNKFLTGLKSFQAQADADTGGDFCKAPAAVQEKWLGETDAKAYAKGAPRSFYRSLKETSVLGYYTSEAGASEELEYLAVPGPYQGEIKVTDKTRAWAT